MRDALLGRRHLVELLLAVALGYALFRVLDSLSQLWLDVVVQHAGRREEGPLNVFSSLPASLSFKFGGTYVPYGIGLAPLSTLILLAAAGLLLRRLQLRCPHCRSVVARDASVCSACSLEIEPAAAS